MKKVVGFILLLTLILIMVGCGVSAKTYAEVLSERDVLAKEKDDAGESIKRLEGEVDSLTVDVDALEKQLGDELSKPPVIEYQIKYQDVIQPLRGFVNRTEFTSWIRGNVQPETVYIEDAFLAAVAIQALGIKEGYLFGIDVDYIDDGEMTVVVSAFIGDELFWWFVEDAGLYDSYGLFR